MHTRFIYIIFFMLTLTACKKWDDHTRLTDPGLKQNLFQLISSNPELSRFTEYLVKTGLDKEISSSKIYTVWAPVNSALQSLDPAIIADNAKLTQYLSNHISRQSWYAALAGSGSRIQMLNGKMINVTPVVFDEALITSGDQKASNGVLHILNKAIAPLPNLWDFLNSSASQFKQNRFIQSQVYKTQDLTNAVVDSINAATGQPVYKPGTDSVVRNRFNDQVFDLRNEEKQYTYFILADTAFERQLDSLKAYFKTGSADSTWNLAAWNFTKDAIVEGVYSINQLPDTLISKFGVKIPIHRNAIVETHRVSNGIVYVVNRLEFRKEEKLPAIVVQGESPTSFMPNFDRRSVTFFRVRRNPVTNTTFADIQMTNIGVASYYIRYRVQGVPSAKYKVYWVAVNDLSAAFSQRLAMGTPTSTTFPYVSLTANDVNNYSERLLGEYTVNNYGVLDMYLTSANNTNTTVANSLVLDYIKLVPSF